MDSPSAQLVPQMDDNSMLDFTADGPPSSPFQSHVENRLASKQWGTPDKQAAEDQTMDIFATPAAVSGYSVTYDMSEDKENVPQTNAECDPQKRIFTPKEPATLDNISSPGFEQQRKSSRESDADLMPPPTSTRNSQRKSPLKAYNSTRPTPSRGSSFTSSSSERSKFVAPYAQIAGQDTTLGDDTCFSAFSEVPDMTTFARLGQSPTKSNMQTPGRYNNSDATPRTSRKRSSPSRSPSPTPRRQKTPANQDGTTFLIDFTQQMENVAAYPSSRRASPSKSTTQPDLVRYMKDQRSPRKSTRQSYATPSKPNNLLNLLDFELPPAPTPRSVPTITVRELESLKSSYLSQISSLKATLSGREAEAESLKRAVGDAERRVGEAQENLRDEKNRREHAEQEKASWERRGQEVENVLNSVKEEVMKGEVEKDDLIRKMEDSDRRAEDAEARAIKAEERFADALAARGDSGEGDGSNIEEKVQTLLAAQIDAKIEAVSRELHAVYKEKHERKVATLKKSYEARNEKKCADLQHRVAELEKSNDDLLAAKDATFSGPVPDARAAEVEAELKAQFEEQKAHLARLENQLQTSQQQQEQLMRELQQERIEKGDLVAAVDEMLVLQAEQGAAPGAMSVVQDFRKSISRPSTLPAAGGLPTAMSKIGKGGPGSKGRLAAGLERMGRTGSN